MAVGKGTDSDEDSYKRKPKRQIINHQVVYESSWVNERSKVSQFGGGMPQEFGKLVGMVRKVVVGEDVCVLVT
jgi:hypothetical protein